MTIDPKTRPTNQDATGWTLCIDPGSREWRRQLGVLAWAALEDLALSAHPSDQGWVAPVGVRDIARGIGVTKDTAARAVHILSSARLVVFERVAGRDGRPRSGYRLQLPDGIQVRPRPKPDDTLVSKVGGGCPDREDKRFPDRQDKNDRPRNGDIPADHSTPAHGRDPRSQAIHAPSEALGRSEVPIQPTLFATSHSLF